MQVKDLNTIQLAELNRRLNLIRPANNPYASLSDPAIQAVTDAYLMSLSSYTQDLTDWVPATVAYLGS